VGGAVARNRVRRRLRAAVRANAGRLTPGHAYLLAADREALTMPFSELTRALAELLASRDGRA
jgi:ribonuclease P protein component